MKHITDDDLTLLFYGEHEAPGLAAMVAESVELSARFEALCSELKLADHFVPPVRGEDYGAEVWQSISSRLTPAQATTRNGLRSWIAGIGQPRFSLAGALSIALVAVLAFMLGRQDSRPADVDAAGQNAVLSSLAAGMDPQRLMNTSVSGHLEQVNIVFTQFANAPDSHVAEGERVTGMLVANRIYRQAAKARGDERLAAFLAELEPLLIELAHEAYRNSPATRQRMQSEVRNDLLLRVRLMNQQLSQSNIST